MESILDSTKKILGLEASYTAFDVAIISFINAAFSSLDQLGVGPTGGYFITDSAATWDEFLVTEDQLHAVKTYIYLKTRVLFDPPATSFLGDAMQKQINELEWRLNTMREEDIPLPEPEESYE